ncbi:transporter [Aureimonas sp. SA4125]|uniref:ZIP family metal transporter n=1 Tax=Aureimonas sp. SA4125 TaxID=2826993 RepID=UPI001CC3F2A2|nr:transporter [Aureimonas sp. SA4125]
MATWTFTLLPWAALVIGATFASFRRPSPATASAVQHLAAGVVFAAAATEVLPDVQHGGSALAIVLGGSAGLGLMFAIKAVGSRLPGKWSLVALTGIDILIDGVVLGIGFAAGAKQGALLLFALTLEILFLGLAATEELLENLGSKGKVIAAVALGGALLPLGAVLGGPVHDLPPFWLTAALSFALIALLYLVTEELLVEAHQKPDSPLVTSLFFVGFLGLLVIEGFVA